MRRAEFQLSVFRPENGSLSFHLLGHTLFCGGTWFVLGSTPNGAGTVVLPCFCFLILLWKPARKGRLVDH